MSDYKEGQEIRVTGGTHKGKQGKVHHATAFYIHFKTDKNEVVPLRAGRRHVHVVGGNNNDIQHKGKKKSTTARRSTAPTSTQNISSNNRAAVLIDLLTDELTKLSVTDQNHHIEQLNKAIDQIDKP